MDATERLDVLVVTLGTTIGWGSSSRSLADALAAAGADVRLVSTGPGPVVRTLMLTDLVQAGAARAVADRAIARDHPRAIIYCSITAALLWPRPGAIWVDSLAAENRPGRHGVWQRVIERRRLAQAPLVLAMAPRALDGLSPRDRPPAVTVPVAVSPSGPPATRRDIEVLAYAGDPIKRRLDLVLRAWSRARRESETLVVAGTDRESAPPGVRFVGRLEAAEYRALVRRARVYINAPVREDFGIAPLEALADGCALVTTPSPGAYPALAIARELDRRLVGDDLAAGLRAALDTPLPGYADHAAELLVPFSPEAVRDTVAERVLPRLLPR